MSYALIINGHITEYPYSLTTFRATNPTISLPIEPTEAQLNEQNIFTVYPIEKPSYDFITQNCNESIPVFTEDKWVQTWEIVSATLEEIEIRKANIKLENASYAKQLLVDTDWTQMSDVNLINKEEFTAYRAVLRQIAVDPQIDVTWPIKPNEQW